MLPTLSVRLRPEFGKGFSARNLVCMVQFATAFTDPQVIAALSRHLIDVAQAEQEGNPLPHPACTRCLASR